MQYACKLRWAAAAAAISLAGCGGGDSLDDPLPETCESVDGFDSCAEASFRAFADDTGGGYSSVDTADDVPDAIVDAIEEGAAKGESYDLMFILDLTGSMGDDLSAVNARIDDILASLEANGGANARVGLATYKDHCNSPESWYTILDLSTDFEALQTELGSISASGGGDTPESVYEAVERTMVEASWENENRFAILIGDAGPHPPEKRETFAECSFTTYEQAVTAARSAGVSVNLYPILVSR